LSFSARDFAENPLAEGKKVPPQKELVPLPYTVIGTTPLTAVISKRKEPLRLELKSE
jgi:hypothetical protein